MTSLDSTAAVVVERGLLRPHPRGTGYMVDARGAGGNPALYGAVLARLHDELDELMFDVIAGVANSGTPLASALAVTRRIPFVNVLVKGARASGLRREIEPDTVVGASVVLIDNWARSGASLLRAAEILADHRATVVGALLISAAPTLPDLPFPVVLGWPMHVLVSHIIDSTKEK